MPSHFLFNELWLDALYYTNPYQCHHFLWEYHFQFMPFWFISTFSGMKLCHKIWALCRPIWTSLHFQRIYPWRLRMLLVTKKSLKLLWKNILYTYSFYTMEEYLSQSWIMYCITRLFIRVVHWFKILCALCKYSWLVFKCLSRYIMYLFIDLYSELTTFPCINLICLIYVL
jgi:hypothetical protein